MPMLRALVEVSDIMKMLDLAELPTACRFAPEAALYMEVEVKQDEIDGYARAPDPERIPTNPRDLRDGLQALIRGQRDIASTLLVRAFDDDIEARRLVEEELRAA